MRESSLSLPRVVGLSIVVLVVIGIISDAAFSKAGHARLFRGSTSLLVLAALTIAVWLFLKKPQAPVP